MQRIVNPKQTRLFDPFDSVLTEKTRKRLLDGWPGVFRHVILELMPVDAISEHFDPVMGRPTEADGGGKSLTRKIPTNYGNNPNHWTAATPSPGE